VFFKVLPGISVVYFLVVYATMAIFPEKNYEPFWMKIKFALCFLFLFFLFEIPGVFTAFWSPLSFVLSYEGSLHEWSFRAGLDRYCALFGMIYAYNYPTIEAWLKKVEAYSKNNELLTKTIVVTLFTLLGAFWSYFYLPMNKFDYNKVHPYTSMIPLTVYLVYRNISSKNRGWVLGLFQWSGRITLETYIAQFHLWLVNDAKGRLIYIDNYPLVNFVIATGVYLLISSLLFETTITLNDALIPPGTTSRNSFKRLSFFVLSWITLLVAVTALRAIF